MDVKSAAEWRARQGQLDYDYALPWERPLINFLRWWDGRPLLRRTPRQLRRA